MLLELYLKHERYETLSAINGIEGITLAKEEQPDLITLDVMMPEMDGWQALRELKTLEETRQIPIIVISVLRDVQVGFEFGASDYLTKPVNRTDLNNAVQRLTSLPSVPKVPPLEEISAVRLLGTDDTPATFLTGGIGKATIDMTSTASDIVTPEIAVGDGVPDVFLVDAREDLVSALAAANRIKLFPSLADVPVIAVTTPEQKDFCARNLAGVFTKSVVPQELESPTE
jgi:CheY-like chemotaxis protein